MSELRAPDPTLDALGPHEPVYVTWMDDATTAHRPRGCEDARLREWEMEAGDARWFAVPCRDRECFPDAPPPGTIPHASYPHHSPVADNLAWQVTSS